MHLDVEVKLKLELKLMVRIMVVLMLRMRHVLFSAWNHFHWFPLFVTIGFAVFRTHIFHLLSLLGVLIAMWKRSRDFLIFDLVGAVNPWGLGLWWFDNVLQIEQLCIIPELLSTSLILLDSCSFKRGHLAHIKQILHSYPGGQKIAPLSKSFHSQKTIFILKIYSRL